MFYLCLIFLQEQPILKEGNMKKSMITLLFLMIFSPAIFAQEPVHPPPGGQEPHKMLEAIKIWKLMDVLELNDEQMVSFLPKLKQMEKHRREAFAEKREMLINLKELVKKDASEKKLRNSINNIVDFEFKCNKEELDLKKQAMSSLSLEQQAKFLIFEARFEEEIRKIIKGLGKQKEREIREKRF
jgi:hypothetical protein